MWLLDENTVMALRAAVSAGSIPTVAQQADFEARAGDGDGVLTVAGDKAEIRISGVLTQKPDFMAMLFGGGNTTYREIISAHAEAEADPEVTEITLAIDSPGGQVAGLFDTLDALQGAKKPLKAFVRNVGASAAYAIASQAGEIVVANRATQVGSVGILANIMVKDNEVTITSSNAPDKSPDVTTDAGRAKVRERLDVLHEIFVDAIAEGRNMTVQAVNADFGRGATLFADEALSRGMIDAISGGGKQQTVADGGDDQMEDLKMDIKALKSEHPDLYAEAVQQGVASERDRVVAHLTMGGQSGDMKTAVTAITEGSEMTATLSAQYMAAGMNRANIEARQADDTDSGAGDGATEAEANDNGADDVASMVEEKLGLEA